MATLIEIEGFSELATALARTGTDVRRALNAGLKDLAEPIAHDAARFAEAGISGLARKRSSDWGAMRVGVAHGFSLIYVAPRERGRRGRGDDPMRRPQFADLLIAKAMDPAVEANEASVIAGAEKIVDDVTRGWWG